MLLKFIHLYLKCFAIWGIHVESSFPHQNSRCVDTLQPQPYPTLQLWPEPEPPPGDRPTSRVRRGRRTLMRG